jgi:hypothetical protein
MVCGRWKERGEGMENLLQRVKMTINRLAERAQNFSYTELEY